MLKIGDFARLGQVSVRMLRHYDAIGLLTPATVDPWSGYRGYSADQLARLNRLVALKELGFTLEEVRHLLGDETSPGRLADMLRARRHQLATDAAETHRRLAEVERRLRLIEREGAMPDYEFTTKPLPALRLADLGTHVDSVAEIGPVMGAMFGRLFGVLGGSGSPDGPAVSWYVQDADGEGMTAHAGWPYAGEPRPGFDVVDLPAEPLAACVTYVGPIASIGYGWQALARWWSEQGYVPSGDCRELGLAEPPSDPDGDWVMELQQPVRPT